MANKGSRLTDYLQLGANLGILVGLILVGLQIREASRATTAQLRLDTWYGSMVSHEIMIGEHLADSWSKAQMNSDDLTARDIVVIHAFLDREWLQNARISRTSLLGYDLESPQLTVNKWVFSLLGNETTLNWWWMNGQRQSTIDANPKLHAAINESLTSLGEEHRRYHLDMLNEVLGHDKVIAKPEMKGR